MKHRYVPLHVHSPFSFLDGASPIEHLVHAAAAYNCPAIAITDHDCAAGAVQLHRHATERGLSPIQGVELTISGCAPDATHHLTLLATGPEGYAALCRLITRAHLDQPRRSPRLDRSLLDGSSGGLIALSGCRRGEIPSLLLRGMHREAEQVALGFVNTFGRDHFYLELPVDLLPGNLRIIAGLARIAERTGIQPVAAGNVHYESRDLFRVHDVLTCIRTNTRIGDVHPERRLNAEHCLKSPEEMFQALIAGGLDSRCAARALDVTLDIAGACRPALVPGRRMYPNYRIDSGESAAAMLRRLTYEGARHRYRRLNPRLRDRLEHELRIIEQLGYAGYFLLVWDVGRFARSRGIRFAGRGSAADSVVAYCLGLTEVDAFQRNLLFERFLSLERAEKPDIDIDFDARRRDEVSAYVREKYGKDNVAGVCTYSTFRARSVIRDVGKALELPADDIDRLARRFPHIGAARIEEAMGRFPELRASGIDIERYRGLLWVGERIAGLPRHIGTHLGGLVISEQPLTTISPLQMSARGVTICQFDRDFVEDLGLLKLDLLSLRTLTAVEETIRLAARLGRPIDYDHIPPTDRETMKMINRGDTIGVFQLESPAQRSLQARLGASRFEDIVASIALIRPGPIKGNMVQPFIDRRRGREPVTYWHPMLEPILNDTYGVILYQEQVIEIATAVAGFSPGEADRLRRVMSHGRFGDEMAKLGEVFIAGAVDRGIDRQVAAAIFHGIEGYASYGFCEAHAAAFANTACRTAYLVRHRPAEFFAALLSCQPMGCYPPRTLCVEARRRGVGILGPDVNRSDRRWTVEQTGGGQAIRAGLEQIERLGPSGVASLLAARAGGYESIEDVRERSGLGRDQVIALIRAGAADSLCSNRRAALWRAAGGHDHGNMPDFSLAERVMMEEETLGFPVTAHPFSLLRPMLDTADFTSSNRVRGLAAGSPVRVAGVPVRPHRPPTPSGRTVVFLSLEDEFGLCDVTVFEAVYQRDGAVLFDGTGRSLAIRGRIERRGAAVSITADEVLDLAAALRRCKNASP